MSMKMRFSSSLLRRQWRQHLLRLDHELPKYHRCFGTSSWILQGSESVATAGGGGGGGVGSATTFNGVLREEYQCTPAWEKRLETKLIQKINLDDFFYDIDKRYQADKVISAIDVDLYVNRVTDEENLEEMEELVHRLRRSPATSDALPSTSYALIRAFLKAGRMDDIVRILNDRWNYGVFVDYRTGNVLMDEFLKQGNNRDAAKIASLFMLEEDFGPATTTTFVLLSCLKYLYDPSPDPWDTSPPKEESEEETKVRVYLLRNPYFDDHFDLIHPNHVIGKTLALASRHVKEDELMSRSVEILGWALYGKWDKVEPLLQKYASNKTPIAKEVVNKVTELCDKAISEIDASPNKTLPKPKVHQFPGVNLDEKDVNQMWKVLNYPENEKFIPQVKDLLKSNKITTKDLNLVDKAQQLLSAALAEREDKEIEAQLKAYEDWNDQRLEELDKQIKRFRKFEVLEDVESKKKELKEKEEVIFFFDNEEEWMMRLPPDEQKGYKLPTEYIPKNWTPFVKTIPPKRERNRKKKPKV